MYEPSYHLTIRPDTTLVTDADGSWVVNNRMRMPLGKLSAGSAKAMKCLFNGGGTRTEIGQLAIAEDGLNTLPFVYLLESRLAGAGVLCRSFHYGEDKQATLMLLGASDPTPDLAFDASERLRLSRFTCLRRESDTLVAETPLTRAKLVIYDPRVASVLQGWSAPATVTEIGARENLLDDYMLPLCGLLWLGGFVARPDDEDQASEGALGLWEFHDAYFHTRSRVGRHNNAYGGTYPFIDTPALNPPPAVKPRPEGAEIIALPKPDLDALRKTDAPFADVVERRRSIRKHDDVTLISKAQLGEFLYRTARVIEVVPAGPQEICRKPYPGGGSVYELEVYPVIDRCEGISTGLYHYRGDDHALTWLADETPEVRRLLDVAWETVAKQGNPQILMIITARFGRVSWKYRSVAYALMLKHVGVLYHQLYLAASAMGLAPCALGGGDSDLFARASGLDYFEEGAVGEFLLGTPAEPLP